MAASQAPREQEQSIKARKSELFEEEQLADDLGARRPFSHYLANAEATPFSTAQKLALWGLGVVVVLILLAALVT